MKILLCFLVLFLIQAATYAEFVDVQNINNFKYLQNAARIDEIILLCGEPDIIYKDYMSWIVPFNKDFIIYEVILDGNYLVYKNKKLLKFGVFIEYGNIKTYKYINLKDD